MARERGGNWDGSNVNEDHITFLRETQRLPGVGNVKGHVPAPREGERVVFRSHFIRGFGLPASDFLRSFLEFYHLQLLGFVVISKKFLRTRKIMVMHSNERGECCLCTLVD